MRISIWLGLAALASLPLLAVQAQPQGCTADRFGKVLCGPADSACLQDQFGAVRCSQPGGGIERDSFGALQCGPGRCIRDNFGAVHCSSVPKGGAALDTFGKAVCTTSCVRGDAGACVVPTPAQ